MGAVVCFAHKTHEKDWTSTSFDEMTMADAMPLNLTALWAMAEDTLGPDAKMYACTALFASILPLPLLCCWRRQGSNGRAASAGSKGKAQKKGETKSKEKPKKAPRVQFCKFCEAKNVTEHVCVEMLQCLKFATFARYLPNISLNMFVSRCCGA